jgi:PEGA domain
MRETEVQIGNLGEIMTALSSYSEKETSRLKLLWAGILLASLLALFVPTVVVAQNQVLGEVKIQGKTKVDKTSGVWVDGQYVGYVKELKGDKSVLLLPGEHEIAVRQAGYIEQVQKVTVEPGKKTTIDISMQKDTKAQFPSGVTSQVKLEVTPDRAAVFVDGGYVGTPKEFSGLGRAMVIAPGKHHVRIALAGYQDFTTEINLRPNQKITIKTDLTPGSITQAGPAIKSN